MPKYNYLGGWMDALKTESKTEIFCMTANGCIGRQSCKDHDMNYRHIINCLLWTLRHKWKNKSQTNSIINYNNININNQ